MLSRTLLLLTAGLLATVVAWPARLTANADDDVAVQTRGPVHEAYARPHEGTPQPGPVAPKRPPEPVPEEPPEQKPEGDNVRWMPGYWSWDAEAQDYLWVSGFWRVMPPERKWVPGYWRQADDGWQWVPGYWAPERQERAPLLEPPPAPLDAGPSIPAPDEGSFYVPGCWIHRAERYTWRPGYWRPSRPGWVWTSSHYCWTPGGYYFVDGYWDRCLEDRGILFAPVVFTRPAWHRPGWVYRPRFTVGISTSFFSAFFVRPSYGHYYFGDYYDTAYVRAGYHPWCVHGPRYHDPLFSYYRWHHRQNPHWHHNVHDVYLARAEGRAIRPPRTLVEQRAIIHRVAPQQVQAVQVVAPLNEFRGNLRLAALAPAQRAEQQAGAERLREVTRQRLQVERPSERGRPVLLPAGNRPLSAPAPAPTPAVPAPLVETKKPLGRPATSDPGKPQQPAPIGRPLPGVKNPPVTEATPPVGRPGDRPLGRPTPPPASTPLTPLPGVPLGRPSPPPTKPLDAVTPPPSPRPVEQPVGRPTPPPELPKLPPPGVPRVGAPAVPPNAPARPLPVIESPRTQPPAYRPPEKSPLLPRGDSSPAPVPRSGSPLPDRGSPPSPRTGTPALPALTPPAPRSGNTPPPVIERPSVRSATPPPAPSPRSTPPPAPARPAVSAPKPTPPPARAPSRPASSGSKKEEKKK